MIYRQTRNAYENLNREMFPGAGEYDIPQIQPTHYVPDQLIGFNYVKTCRTPERFGVHFFVDDYQFTRIWQQPEYWTDKLSPFACVRSPDFSGYIDFPKAVRVYQRVKNHWLGAYWQLKGLTVIPTIQWGDECDFDWCFDGDPMHSTVAVSSVGTQLRPESRRIFSLGFHEMLHRLRPSKILFYGQVPEDCADERIIRIPAFQEKHRRAQCL